MGRNRQQARDSKGQFAAGEESEIKRGRGDRASGRLQIRSKHKRALTAEELGAFLGNLAETCNVALSARRIGRSARVFYDLRRRDSGFRADWMEALREGYDLLETEMVRRARFGTRRDVFYRGQKTATTLVFSDATALRLLHLHRKSVEAMRAADSAPRRDARTLFDELAARLAEAEAAARARESDDGEAEAEAAAKAAAKAGESDHGEG
ncbi:MAG TPA: hypothetical protein VF759_11355 [Allosphingosinicella sp.]|jgi:hypothetical protein